MQKRYFHCDNTVKEKDLINFALLHNLEMFWMCPLFPDGSALMVCRAENPSSFYMLNKMSGIIEIGSSDSEKAIPSKVLDHLSPHVSKDKLNNVRDLAMHIHDTLHEAPIWHPDY